MECKGQGARLFHAFSRINAEAYKSDRLLSCPVLSKAPNYGNILENIIEQKPIKHLSYGRCFFLWARYFLANITHFCFLLVTRILWALYGIGKPSSKIDRKGACLYIDVFALLPKIAREQIFYDNYLPGLAEQGASKGYYPLYIFRLYGSRNLFTVIKAIKALHATRNGVPDICLLQAKDWCALLAHAIMYIPALCSLCKNLKRAIKECKRNSQTGGEDSSPLLEEYILQALYETLGSNIITPEVSRLVGKRLTKLLLKKAREQNSPPHTSSCVKSRPDIVVSWYENQPSNKAFYRGARQAINEASRHQKDQCTEFLPPRFIGAQLLIWPDSLLNNHPDDEEAKLGLAPDKVLVNGAWFLPKSTLQKYEVGPALRYKEIFTYSSSIDQETQDGSQEVQSQDTLQKRIAFEKGNASEVSVALEGSKNQHVPKRDEKKSLLVLLSYHPEETIRVLQTVLPLAKEGYSLVYKFHPATTVKEYAHWLPNNPMFADKNFYVALQTAHTVIGSGSGALAEAVACGVPAITVSGIKGVTLNYLPSYGNGVLWVDVKTTEGIRIALKKMRHAQQVSEFKHSVEKIREMLFTNPTPELITKAFELDAQNEQAL